MSTPTIDFSKYEDATPQIDFSKYESAPASSVADQSHAEVSAHPGGVRGWLTDLESDLRYGGEQTAVGRGLKAIGYQGAESLGGQEGTAGKTLVSPLTGPVFAAHGVAEAASGHPLKGAGEVLSGVGEAAQIPAAFVAPEAGEAAAEKISSLTPSAMREAAGNIFQKVTAKAGNFPVDVEGPGQSALKIRTMYQRGAGYTPPSVITRFLNRVTQPNAAPMTYEEARDFYSNASRLSADEAMKLTPRVKMQLGDFVQQLGTSIQQAASKAGVGGEHAKAMFDYAKAMRYADRVEAAKDLAVKTVVKASGTAATAYGAKKIWDAADSK